MYEIHLITEIKIERKTHLNETRETESDHIYIHNSHNEGPILSLVLKYFINSSKFS